MLMIGASVGDLVQFVKTGGGRHSIRKKRGAAKAAARGRDEVGTRKRAYWP